jgi:hypothetical protein
MPHRRHVSLASLLVVLGGGAFLSSPAQASPATQRYSCYDSVQEYCQWVANNYCTYGARCVYDRTTCEVLDAECI